MSLAGQAEFDETLVAARDAKMQVRHCLSLGFPLPFYLSETVAFIVATPQDVIRKSTGKEDLIRKWPWKRQRWPWKTLGSLTHVRLLLNYPLSSRATPLCPFVTGLALPFLDLSLP